ncbi:MAG TPA: MBL fold metallo-hydrolase [Nocardioides sp.]|uniref:MBL fold metallo-hydrolase n=1 Tax=uncultured Nocardioides sp. TaxID=198441 RepID=UPI000EE90CF6|nr:MBL fold metallo-hydrolase [uncultured Nocardioides sp.]HCB05912.1 MBL fold hydrolase [Nocardioides sp.]HRD60608.1 MBL fold metallo-hydrolase [Nocardioides sp.]HRI94362.1 MBL fold metallo-hydrolase [Nocardioides sp.]HRK44294.1 MBL fold metallo-hydrolase [Nocardioides sp.]
MSVLFAGYAPWPVPWPVGTTADVASTVAFLRDGDQLMIVDPGFVPDRKAILDPLAALGYSPDDITDVIFSHHHPDHTLNAALFPNAQVHDVWGIYRNDKWTFRPSEGAPVSPGIRLLATPGHSEADITTLVATDDGMVAFTHLWWDATTPATDDPVGMDQEAFHLHRERVLALDPALVVPGHGPAFVPGPDTPR